MYRKERIQPFRGTDGDFELLLRFAKIAAKKMMIAFPKDLEVIEKHHEQEPWVHDIYTQKHIKNDIGFLVTHKKGYEPKYGGHAEDRVTIESLGFPEDQELEIECTRYYHDPRFIELRVKTSDNVANELIVEFRQFFQQDESLTPEEIKSALVSASVALKRRAWSGAEKYARMVLKAEPKNPDALFTLGLSLAAMGDEDHGEKYLTEAIELDPTNYDAYYNLSLMFLKRKDYVKAIHLLKKGLQYSEDNHPILYQLARVLELSGDIENAIKLYKRTIETSPNPDGAFHYSGMDFTEHAKEALLRLEDINT